MTLKNIPTLERPREKALKYGIQSLSNRELLAIIIKNGYRNHSVLEVVDELLISCDGIQGLGQMNLNDLISIKGIHTSKALEVLAIFELFKRTQREKLIDHHSISTPDDLKDWLMLEIGFQSQEYFYVIFLDTKNHVISYQNVFKGGLNGINIHPREIFKEAIIRSACKIIIAHNHPSGDVTPSRDDIITTKNLIEAGKTVNIPVVDHLIVTKGAYYSLRKEKILNFD